ncbi:uncharacterized protein TNCV_5077601 [Trichonephila clavipes]|uniref:Uncharacterized protein n=1 Tax=Trichonephila clavipes TaxID=2585209 RepID=A0A8X6S6C5_TRICX|nr:uncharacterized protein TNCV_5077601 [Trichonephila clavipes]
MKWIRQSAVKFLKVFVIVAGFSNKDKLKVKKVSSKTKINSLYYQQNILEPIFEEEIPTLYGKDIGKVEFHMNKGSNHTSKSTAAYSGKKESETGIKCIPFDEIPLRFCNGLSQWCFRFID